MNDRKVVAESQFLQFNETDGIASADKVYVQSEFMINGQINIRMDPSGSVLVRDLKVNGREVLLASPSLSWDESIKPQPRRT